MLVLDTTSKSITVVMSGAAATTNPSFTAAYADNNGTTFTEGANDGVLSGTTPVTVVAAPAASTRRIINTITIENTDTAPVTLTVGYLSTASTRVIAKVTLQVGDTWTTSGAYDTNGSLKQVVGNVNLATQVIGILPVANGGTGLSALTAGYIPYGNGSGAYSSYSGLNYNASTFTLTAPVLIVNSTTSTTPNLTFNASNSGFTSGAAVSGSYLQTVIQNSSNTAGASANYVVSNNLGTDSTYYGEFGMNSSTFSASTPSDFYSINNGVYFSGHDGDITFGSGNGFKSYFAWGSTGQYAHVINASGALGFSTNLGTTPALSGTTGYGTSGQALISAGSAAAPAWGTLGVSGGGTGTTTSTGTGSVVLSSTPTLVTPTITNYVETLYTASGSTSISLANGTVQEITTSGSTTITLPASVTGKSFTVIVKYNAADALTWAGGSTLKWAGGTTPTPTSATGKYDIFNFYQDGTNTYGSVFGQNY